MSSTFSPGLPNPKPIPSPSKDFRYPAFDSNASEYDKYCASLHPSISQLACKFILSNKDGWTMLNKGKSYRIEIKPQDKRFLVGASARVGIKIDTWVGKIYIMRSNSKSIMEFNIGDVNIDGFIL